MLLEDITIQQFIRIIGVRSGAAAGPNAGVNAVISVAPTGEQTTTVQFDFSGLLDLGEVITEIVTVSVAALPMVVSIGNSPFSIVEANLSALPTGQALCTISTNFDRTIELLGTIPA